MEVLYVFTSERKSIRFAVDFRPWPAESDADSEEKRPSASGAEAEAEAEAVVSLYTAQSHHAPQQGSVVTRRAGTFVFRFDNYNSYFSSKTVSFAIAQCKLASPEELAHRIPKEMRLAQHIA